MVQSEIRERGDQAYWESFFGNQSVNCYCIIGLCKPDMIGLQETVHRQRQQNDLEEPVFNM